MAIQSNVINFRQEIQNTFSKQNVVAFAKRIVADTATSTLATALFTSFNPFAGLIIGAVSHPTTKLINWACKQLHVGENSIIAKTSARVLSAITGIAIATMLAQAAGLNVSFVGACVITLSTFGLNAFAGAIGIGLVVLSVLAAQAILKALPKNENNQTELQARETVEHFHRTVNDTLDNRIGIERHIQKALTDFHLLVDEGRRLLGLDVEEPAAEQAAGQEPANILPPTAPPPPPAY